MEAGPKGVIRGGTSRALVWPLLAVGLALPALTLFFRLGLPNGDDSILHLMKLVALDHQWQSGVIYARWMPELTLGLGYPLFNYYGLAPSYMAELLHLAGAGFEAALALEYAGLVLVAGLGMWRLAADIFGALPEPRRRWAALVAALAYVYAPYLMTNAYVRGAVGELAGQALLPWLLWCCRRLFHAERPERWAVLAGLGVAALAVTHSLMLLFSLPVLLSYLALLGWQNRRSPQRLVLAAASMALAAGLSAFYWLPLIAERQYVSPATFARQAQIVASSALTWRTIVNGGFLFQYGPLPPFQLGLVQVGLGVAGLWLGRRYFPDWGYWAVLAIVAVWASSVYALPLWLSSPALVTISFPWRLLSIASLPLALATGGLLAIGPAGRWAALWGLALIVLITVVNFPRLPWLKSLHDPQDNLGLAELAQFELATSEYGATNNPGGEAPDFLPRWAEPQAIRQWRPTLADNAPTNGRTVTLSSASPYELRGTIASAEAGSLRFKSFYFPGWRFYIDDGHELGTYATTELGLLTVDVPAGAHSFRLVWQGTAVQAAGTIVSLGSLVVLAAWLWLGLRQRLAASMAAGAFVAGVFVGVRGLPAPTALQAPARPAVGPGVELLGVRTQAASAHSIYLYPYWFVSGAPSAWQAHWQLRDDQGRLVAETNASPWFDTATSAQWPSGTVVDDAFQLALPPGLTPGDYALEVCLHPLEALTIDCAPEQTVPAGKVNVPGTVPPAPRTAFTQPAGIRFGHEMVLAGLTLKQNGQAVTGAERYQPIKPGDVLEYSLYWQGLHALAQDYHGFMQLVDGAGQPLVQQDFRLGADFFPPRLWDAFYIQHQTNQLIVPTAKAGAVYWATLGVYDRAGVRLSSQDISTGAELGSAVRLAALKLVVPPAARPQHPLTAQLGDMARLLGYDISLPAGGLRAGSQMTLTLYYQARQGTASDLTRFVHIYDPVLGLAGQSDAPPQQGLNPTSAWLPGEVIVDVVPVPITTTAAPGRYAVQFGFYDPAAQGARLAIVDGAGQAVADRQLALTAVNVEP